MKHRLANCRLDAVRPDEDVARRGGPIVEAELDRGARALCIALKSLGWEGAAARRQAVQQDLMKLCAMDSHQSTWRVREKVIMRSAHATSKKSEKERIKPREYIGPIARPWG